MRGGGGGGNCGGGGGARLRGGGGGELRGGVGVDLARPVASQGDDDGGDVVERAGGEGALREERGGVLQRVSGGRGERTSGRESGGREVGAATLRACLGHLRVVGSAHDTHHLLVVEDVEEPVRREDDKLVALLERQRLRGHGAREARPRWSVRCPSSVRALSQVGPAAGGRGLSRGVGSASPSRRALPTRMA